MHIADATLKRILIDSSLVDEKAFEKALEEARRSNLPVADILIGNETISEGYLTEILQPYLGAPVVDLHRVTIPIETLALIPETYAKAKNIVAFDLVPGKTLKVAMVDPLDLDTIEYLRAKFNVWVEPHLTSRSSLKYGLKQYKKKIGVEFTELIQENIEKSMSMTGETDLAKLAEAVPIITIVDSIIEHAIVLGASDIHFEPLQKELLVRYRIDGIMQEALSMPTLIASILVARVKILASLQIDEHRVPQDGRFRFEMDDGTTVDVRVNVMPVLHGEKVEMRLLKSSARPLTLDELGLNKKAVIIVESEIEKPHGMILVTGPTGHGKTTTLYAILHILNTTKVNITTIEDPIEYEIPHINQTQVNTKAGVTFANGLRSLLRQNPDIIMIGEIRDSETVDISVHAALTGHLVLTSLHTNDAPSAMPRLLDMGAPAFLLASTVNLIIAQRLVRKICLTCIESYPVTSELKRLTASQNELFGGKTARVPRTLFRGKGCNVCGGTGFQGQIGIFEVMAVNENIRALVIKSVSTSELRRQAIKDGMTTMFEDGMEKVEKGVTMLEEVLRVVRE